MYTHNQTVTALSNEQLQRLAPSIFNQAQASNLSQQYTHINTLDVINALQKEGFLPVKATQTNCRHDEKVPYAKHMIRFRHASIDFDRLKNVGDSYPEVVLINSHDGLSSYRLYAGLFRLVCSNGLISGKKLDEVRVIHKGDIVNNVIEGSYQVLSRAVGLLEKAKEFSSVVLNLETQKDFAQEVHTLRFGTEKTPLAEAIHPTKFLNAKRWDEYEKGDLWTLFNVAQENLIKGNLRGYHRNPETRIGRYVTTRAVKSIDETTRLNQGVWNIADNFYQRLAA